MCNAEFVPSRLRFPIEKKDYAEDEFIASSWENATWFLKSAFVLTIFGYSAPTSDTEAVDMMNLAWRGQRDKIVERVEVIDIQSRETLREKWKPFVSYDHDDYRKSLYDSWIAKYPRRSCEALYAPTVNGRPAEQFPIPQALNFKELYDWFTPIAQREVELSSA